MAEDTPKTLPTDTPPAPKTEPTQFVPQPPPNGKWEDWAWRRVQDAERQKFELQQELTGLKSALDADRSTREKTDTELRELNEQILSQFAEEKARRVNAERAAHLATLDVKDKTAQARLMREYDLATSAQEEPPEFDTWLEAARKDDPFISAYFKSLGTPTTADPDAIDPENPPEDRPPATAPRRGSDPPPANGTRYTDTAVSAMDPTARRRHAPKIARELMANGSLRVSPELAKRLGWST